MTSPQKTPPVLSASSPAAQLRLAPSATRGPPSRRPPEEKAFSRGERLFASHPEQIGANARLSRAAGSGRSPSAPRPPRPQAASPQRPRQHRDPSSHGEDPLVAEPRVALAGGCSLAGNKSTAGLLPPGPPAPLAPLPGRGTALRVRGDPEGSPGAQPCLSARNPDRDLEGCSPPEQTEPRSPGCCRRCQG